MQEKFEIIGAAIGSTRKGVPTQFPVFAPGIGELYGDRKYLIDKEAFDAIAKDFQHRGNDLVIDYEHQTLSGQKAPAAGWIKNLSWDDQDGIIAHVQWNSQAAGYIQRGEYRYFSPVFYVRKTDRRVIKLLAVALTNAPKINNLQPLAAKMVAKYGDDILGTEGGRNMVASILSSLELPGSNEKEFSESVMEAAKALGNTSEDIVQYGGITDGRIPENSKKQIAESVLAVAKLFGNTGDDLVKYGLKDDEYFGFETDEDKINWLLGV